MKWLPAFLRKLHDRVKAVLNLARGRGYSAEVFDMLYFLRTDPWKYRTSELEQGKYRKMLSLLPQETFAQAIELGCSEGVFTEMLAPRTTSLRAVDFAPTAVARATRLLRSSRHVSVGQLDIKHTEPGGEYDLIVASEVLYYMGGHDQIRAVGRRVLGWMAPGGHLLLCHMRTQTDEDEGFSKPRWTPRHPGAFTINGIFDRFPELLGKASYDHPLYSIRLYQRVD